MEMIFGTDGIRARVGSGVLNNENLQKLADAIAQWLVERYGVAPVVLIGHDTRQSAGYVKSVLKSKLLARGITIFDGGIVPTPAVFQLIKQQPQFHCGIIISASHNPYADNGIKIIDAHSGKLSLEDEQRISSLYSSAAAYHEINADLGMEHLWPQALDVYAAIFDTYFEADFLRGKKIVLDCAHGAAYRLAPILFNRYGAQVILLHAAPNGININEQCGAVHIQALQKAVVEQGADAGFAFDGDADRVIAVNREGVAKDGDDILALLAQHPAYAHTKMIIGTVMTNQGCERHMADSGISLLRTPVGDKYVAAAMKEQCVVLGGEKSGHIICGDYAITGDGMFAALRTLQAMALTDNWQMTTFTHYPQILINLPIQARLPLDQDPVASLIKYSENQLHNGRILVRYSGTELLLRVMVEDDEFAHAQNVCTLLSSSLQKVLSR